MKDSKRAIVVGTSSGLHRLGSSPGVEFYEQRVDAVARRGSIWWSIVDECQIWNSVGGTAWNHVLDMTDSPATCLLPIREGVLIGTLGASLFSVIDCELKKIDSFEQVSGRDDWNTPRGELPSVRSMSNGETGTIFVNVHVGGILRSEDRGRTWKPTIDIGSDVHQVLFDRNSGLMLAACAKGLADSGDSGGTWVLETEGLTNSYLRSVAVSDETVLVSASGGPESEESAIYRRPIIGDEPFSKCQEGLPEWLPKNIDTGCLAATGHESAFGTAHGDVYASNDDGESWSIVANNMPEITSITFS